MKLLSFLIVSYLALAPAPAAAQQAAPDTLVGTVHTLNLGQGQLKVLVGVGMALRAESLRVSPAIPVSAAGASLPLAALRPGDVVRVIGGTQQGSRVAYSIERLTASRGAR
ncbi:MAG TPA: hypothetical protein VGA20_08940 [Gemmatimonadales bacterium]